MSKTATLSGTLIGTPIRPSTAAPSSFPLGNATPFKITYLAAPHGEFHQIGHSLLALVVGLVGGMLAGMALREERRSTPEHAASDQPLVLS